MVAARRELDPAKRGALYKAIEAAWIEDAPMLPCFCSNVHNLMARNVEGFVQLPYSNFGDQFGGMRLT
jgi:peptide/nickel transport system substrate-binding protein